MKTNEKSVTIGKREQRKAERRESILQIAQQSFLDNGYDRTTMSGIAEIMGGSKGTLWSYFDSKEALFEAVIDRAAVHFRAELISALDPKGPPLAGLRRFTEAFIRKISGADAVALQRMIIGEGPRFPELGPIFYARAPEVTRQLLSAYISQRMEIGALRDGDAMQAANMLLALCSGGHHQRVLWSIETYDEKIASDEATIAVDQFLRVYGPGTDSARSTTRN